MALSLMMALLIASSFGAHGEDSKAMPSSAQHITRASWYGPRFFGHTRADGKTYAKDAVFVAHRSYPLGTTLMITDLKNHRTIVATVEDRGPYVTGRDLDLSYAAAKQLGMLTSGTALVSYHTLTVVS